MADQNCLCALLSWQTQRNNIPQTMFTAQTIKRMGIDLYRYRCLFMPVNVCGNNTRLAQTLCRFTHHCPWGHCKFCCLCHYFVLLFSSLGSQSLGSHVLVQ